MFYSEFTFVLEGNSFFSSIISSVYGFGSDLFYDFSVK